MQCSQVLLQVGARERGRRRAEGEEDNKGRIGVKEKDGGKDGRGWGRGVEKSGARK